MDDTESRSVVELAGDAVGLCWQKFVPLAVCAALILTPVVVFGLLQRDVSRFAALLVVFVQAPAGAFGIGAVALIVDAARTRSPLSLAQIATRIRAHAKQLVIVWTGYLVLFTLLFIAAMVAAWVWSALVHAAGYQWNPHNGTANGTLELLLFGIPASFVGLAGALACVEVVLGDAERESASSAINVLFNSGGHFAGAGIVFFLPAAVLYFVQLYVFSTFKVHAPLWLIDVVRLPFMMWYCVFAALLYFDLLARHRRGARFDIAAAQAATARNGD